jgi:hypothetical protein
MTGPSAGAGETVEGGLGTWGTAEVTLGSRVGQAYVMERMVRRASAWLFAGQVSCKR